jgi:alkylated DNA repair protein alkB family protein 7
MYRYVKFAQIINNTTFRRLHRAYVTSVISAQNSVVGCRGDQVLPFQAHPHVSRLSTVVVAGCDKDANKTGNVPKIENYGLLPASADQVIEATDPVTAKEISESLRVYQNFISEEEEKSLFDEVEPYLKRMRYETSHWDDAIYGYRETERKQWSQKNKEIIQRVRTLAFPPGTPQLAFVHVLDVMATGAIRAHIDSVRFCGSTIAGMCLLSSAVMRFTHDIDKARFADALLLRRSLYIMQGKSRYDYAHEVLDAERSKFRGQVVQRERRISVICRNEPPAEDSEKA